MANADATRKPGTDGKPGRRGRGGRDSAPAAAAAPPAHQQEEKAINAKIDGDVADRAMNAFYAAHAHARWRDYVQAALDEYTARLESEHNDGKPFPPRPAEQLPRGRRVGISPYRAG